MRIKWGFFGIVVLSALAVHADVSQIGFRFNSQGQLVGVETTQAPVEVISDGSFIAKTASYRKRLSAREITISNRSITGKKRSDYTNPSPRIFVPSCLLAFKKVFSAQLNLTVKTASLLLPVCLKPILML